MILWLLALALGAVAAVLAYPRSQWTGAGRARRAVAALAVMRGAAVTMVAALLLGAPRAPARPLPPLLAVDVSASWRRAAADPAGLPGRVQWVVDSVSQAAVTAGGAGTAAPEVWWVGDSLRPAGSSAPRLALDDQATRVRPAVDLANATGRALWLVSDGVLDDAEALGDAPPGSRWVVPTADPRADLAVAALDVPSEARAGDTLAVQAELVAGGRGAPGGLLEWRLDGVPVASSPVNASAPWGAVRVGARLPTPRGGRIAVVTATLAVAGDLEPHNDTLRSAVTLADRPAAVLVSSAPDLDVREVLRILRGALRVPAEAYLRVAPGQWRVEGSLAPIDEDVVRQRAREAAVLVIHGDSLWRDGAGPARGAAARAIWTPAPPPSGRAGQGTPAGEWYVAPPDAPLRGGAEVPSLLAALAALPVDSLAPIALPSGSDSAALGGATPGPLLAARLGKRGPARPVVVASQRGGRREVRIQGSGYAGWALRGGRSAEAFAALWGSVFDWLAAGRADQRLAVPARGAFRAGEPILWRRGGADSVVTVRISPARGSVPVVGARADSVILRFGADGREAWSPALPPGDWAVDAPGGRAVLVVNASPEWVPRPPASPATPPAGALSPSAPPRLVEAGWPFVLALLLLSAEWIGRRYAGYR
ncbi:MAG: hypothetical protein KJT01_01790 [Gemmatimonadetes bacterium]|nr:hypothetical protein [Gemmatimonadota bacterium]